MKETKVVEATLKEESKEILQDFFFPSAGITIKAVSLKEAKKQLNNIS